MTEEEEQSEDEYIDSGNYYYSRFASYLNVDEQEQIFGLASIQPGNPVYVVVVQKAHVRRSNNILVSSIYCSPIGWMDDYIHKTFSSVSLELSLPINLIST